jgi:hypothetical protein
VQGCEVLSAPAGTPECRKLARASREVYDATRKSRTDYEDGNMPNERAGLTRREFASAYVK